MVELSSATTHGATDPAFLLDGFGDDTLPTLVRLLRAHAREHPRAVALKQKDRGIWHPVTWLQYEQTCFEVAAGLAQMDYRGGDHIAILSENRKEWLFSQLGINFLGAVPAGLYPTSPAAEIRYLLAYSDAAAVICEDQEQVDKILEIRDDLPLLRQVFAIDMKGLSGYQGVTAFKDLCAAGRDAATLGREHIEQTLAGHHPDDTALMVFTSGSTGPPKGALISFRNIAAGARASGYFVQPRASDSVLSYLPLCHVAEQIFSVFLAVQARYTVNFGESLRTVDQDLREVAPTVFLGVPRIWEKMQANILVKTAEAGALRGTIIKRGLAVAQRLGRDPSSVGPIVRTFWYWLLFRPLQNLLGLRRARFCCSGAAPIGPELLNFLQGLGLPLREGFGMTETAGIASAQPLTGPCEGRVGFPIPGTACRIAEDGELLIQGPNVFSGYYKMPEATRQALQDGWLYTGDIATCHRDGSISIIDRKKDVMITAGGKNLTPSVIENQVKTSAYIKECIVVADQRKFVAALIQIDPDTVATWAESHDIAYTTFRSLSENPQVRDLVTQEVGRANAELAPAEQVRRFHLLTKELDHDDGEVTATMKVRRQKISESYAQEIERLYAPEAA